MKYPFTYVVIYYDYDETTKKNKYFREAGIGFADNYAEAAHMLEETFGEDLVRIVNIFLMESGDLLCLPEEYIIHIENDAIKPVECDIYGNPIPLTNLEKNREKLEKFKQAVKNSQSGKLDND